MTLRITLFALLMGTLAACTSQTKQPDEAANPGSAAPGATAPVGSGTSGDTTALLNTLAKQTYPNYEVEQFKTGDLNADGRADMIVLLRGTQPCDTLSEPAYCRKALLVLNGGFPRLRIAAANDHVVDCTYCGGAGVGDPHQGIVMKGNYFSFESLYGACTEPVTRQTLSPRFATTGPGAICFCTALAASIIPAATRRVAQGKRCRKQSRISAWSLSLSTKAECEAKQATSN